MSGYLSFWWDRDGGREVVPLPDGGDGVGKQGGRVMPEFAVELRTQVGGPAPGDSLLPPTELGKRGGDA